MTQSDMKKVDLVYWDEENFGDALSPYIVESLSGLPAPIKRANGSYVRKLAKALLTFSFGDIKAILFPWQSSVVGVGSIIEWGNAKSKIWGSGFMNNSGTFGGGQICAVRGPYTANRLVNLGFPKCDIYGDPALLLPLFHQAATKKKYKLGIIPHWKETDKFIELYADRYKVIDLRTSDIDKVMEEITSCEYILSSSLHGVIVPHAYNIPALWIKDGYIDTDGFKFFDYFASVGIPKYTGFTEIGDILSNEDSWMRLFEENAKLALIPDSLPNIQRKLIAAAPFPVQKKYKMI